MFQQSLRNCAKHSSAGFTILELMVVSFLSLIVAGLVMATAISNKRVFGYDMVRTRIDQNLRGAMDTIGSELRIGGENLTATFPAFEIQNGASGAPDTLTVRRNLLDEVLAVCTAITAGAASPNLYFAVPTPPSSACSYSGQAQNYASWRTKRTSSGGTTRAFVYNLTSRQGEFFNYVSETNSGTSYAIQRSAGTWANAYAVGSSSAYILEEWQFSLVNGLLQLQQNGDPTSLSNVSSELTNMQIKAILNDGSTRTSWTRADRWDQLQAIEVTLTAQETYQKRVVKRSLTSQFFPRNILSQ